jgi:hypothetical protein
MQPFRPFAFVAALSLSLAATAASATSVVSTFDSDADGWTSFGNGGTVVSWSSAGGNPGGQIGMSDVTGDWGYFQAPSQFLGPAEYGGTLSFDLRHTNSAPTAFPVQYRVRVGLQGNGVTLISESLLPTQDWLNYAFSLTETAGWRVFGNLGQNYSTGAPMVTQAGMQAILANLTRIVIAADYTDGCTLCGPPSTETTYLDNVRIDVAAIPLPATLPLLLLGAGALALAGRRRRA